MIKQNFQLKLLHKLSPQQIQLMKLIQLPTQAFEQRLKQEIEENPALDLDADTGDAIENQKEEDDFDASENDAIETEDINIDDYLSDDEIPQYKLQSNNQSKDQEENSIPFASGMSFHQMLQNQLQTFRLDDEEVSIASFLVGSLDESGYLRRDLLDLVDDLAFTQNIYTTEKDVLRLLKDVIQKMEPIGIGARDLKECLLIQLSQKTQSKSRDLAIKILAKNFEPFIKKHFEKLMVKLEISEKTLKEAIREIEKLNPKPGGAFSGNHKITQHIVPDFSIQIVEGELELSLNGRNAPELHISHAYRNMLEGYQASKQKNKSQKEAVVFIKQKLDAAKGFIDAIKQRQQTLLATMTCILNYQREYFLSGDERKLRPMILKDIADQIEMDISTVSRVVSSKYASTPYGTLLIKELFSEAMKNDQGEDVSTREIKNILKTLVAEEDKRKPLTDDKLALKLKENGYPIARRTVAKYREQLDLPVARLRKEI